MSIVRNYFLLGYKEMLQNCLSSYYTGGYNSWLKIAYAKHECNLSYTPMGFHDTTVPVDETLISGIAYVSTIYFACY